MFMRSAGKRMILYGMLPFDIVKVLAIYIHTHIYIYIVSGTIDNASERD